MRFCNEIHPLGTSKANFRKHDKSVSLKIDVCITGCLHLQTYANPFKMFTNQKIIDGRYSPFYKSALDLVLLHNDLNGNGEFQLQALIVYEI